jgi:hypothetical protein
MVEPALPSQSRLPKGAEKCSSFHIFETQNYIQNVENDGQLRQVGKMLRRKEFRYCHVDEFWLLVACFKGIGVFSTYFAFHESQVPFP